MDPPPSTEGQKDVHTSVFHSASISLQKLSDSVDAGISRAFRKWGLFISVRPYTVIGSCIVFTVIWAVCFIVLFEIEKDNSDLYTPDDATSFGDKDYVDGIYNSYTSRARIVSVRHPNHLQGDGCERLLLLKDNDTAKENIRALFRVYQEIESVEIEYDHITYGFTDICIRPTNVQDNIQPCLLTSILDLWNYDETIINGENFNPLADINADGPLMDRFGFELDVKQYLGKNKNSVCESDNERSDNVEAFGFTLIYEFEPEEIRGAEFDPQSLKWIEVLGDRMRDLSKTLVLDTYLADEAAIEKESDKEIQEDISLLSIGYILIVVFTNVILFRNNWHATKTHLTSPSVISIGMAIITAFGMAQAFQVKFNPVVQVLPFLILGLGIDDTFVIVGAYHRVPIDLPIPEKIAQTLERAGSSIFVTSATDFCAFMMGLNSRLPALRQFSVHASLAISFDFFYQVTFFVAFLVLEARREARYRNGSPKLGVQLGCGNTEYDETVEKEGHPQQKEMQKLTKPDPEAPTTSGATPSATVLKNPLLWKKIRGSADYDPKAPGFLTRIAGEYIPSVTLHPFGRVAVILVELAVLSITIYGCTRVKMNFNYIDMFTPDDSPLKTGFQLESRYFEGQQILFSVYTKEAADGDYFYHQQELRDLKTALDDDPYVVAPVITWFQSFENWLAATNRTSEFENNRIPNPRTFNALLREYLDGTGSVYRSFVVFSNGSDPHVISSQIDAATIDIIDGEQSIDLLDSIRDSIEKAAPSFDPIAFSIAFLFFDGYRVIARETVRNVLLAAVGVFIMNVVVLASVPMAFIVVSMVGLTDVMLFGYMWYVDQYFNPVTAINLVLAVGIAVDYSAHIAHSFMVLEGGTRLERAKGALEHIGGEVIAGAFTTWLGIILMSVGEHYIFRSFFEMFFAIIVAGAWHGIIFLPVVLSFFGSAPYGRQQKTNIEHQ